MSVTMAEAKKDFQKGIISGFQLHRVMGSWRVLLAYKTASFNDEYVLVDARSKEPREFKSLDSAVAAVEAIGLKVVALAS